MTYKCALAGVPYGGGKTVIIANANYPKTDKLLVTYAARVNLLNGQYYTGEDMGIDKRDINILVKHSKFIIGRRNLAGDLGPWAALGVFSAMKTALKEIFGSEKMQGRTFAIKGLGKVGFELAILISKENGRLVGADINQRTAKAARKKFPKMRIVNPEEIHKEKVDVYVPCAMGGEFSSQTTRELHCAIICGGANNQLASKSIGEIIHRKGILYIPDYLANAGGLINVVGELRKGGYDREWVKRKTKAIGTTARQIIELSKRQNKPTSEVTDHLAENIFQRKAR